MRKPATFPAPNRAESRRPRLHLRLHQHPRRWNDKLPMRLSPHEIAAIKAAAAHAFGADATVRLFGSRLDDSRRGGDIDLLLEVEPEAATTCNEARFYGNLFERIDEQRVDVLLAARGREPTPIERIAYRDGIVL